MRQQHSREAPLMQQARCEPAAHKSPALFVSYSLHLLCGQGKGCGVKQLCALHKAAKALGCGSLARPPAVGVPAAGRHLQAGGRAGGCMGGGMHPTGAAHAGAEARAAMQSGSSLGGGHRMASPRGMYRRSGPAAGPAKRWPAAGTSLWAGWLATALAAAPAAARADAGWGMGCARAAGERAGTRRRRRRPVGGQSGAALLLMHLHAIYTGSRCLGGSRGRSAAGLVRLPPTSDSQASPPSLSR